MSKTLPQVRALVRQRANMENSAFVTDAELNGYINGSFAELHDLLTETYEDYFTTLTTTTVLSGANTIVLPTDFFKLRRVQWGLADRWRHVYPVPLSDIEKWSSPGSLSRGYVLLQNALFLLPEADASGSYRLWYAMKFQELANDAALVDDSQYWHEYGVVDAAIKCLVKEESDVSALLALKEALRVRIQNAAANRDAGAPAKILRVAGEWDDYP